MKATLHHQTRTNRILIVDDQAIELQLCKITFRQIDPNLELKTFRNGEAVLEYLREVRDDESIDLMLLDLKMPRLDGLDVLGVIQKEELKSFPIVLFTTSQLHQDKDRAYRLGADDFIEKPVDLLENQRLFEHLLHAYGLDTPDKATA